MKFKIGHTKSAQQTVDTLRKDIANSQFRRTKVKILAFAGRLKRFYREYRLPSIATATFFMVITALFVVRQLEQTSLLALKNEVTEEGVGYSALLSTDEADEFARGDTTETTNNQRSITASSAPTSNSTQSTSTSFVFGNGSSSGGSTTTGASSGGSSSGGGSSGSGGGTTDPGDSGGGNPVITNPFGASIDSMNQLATTLQCSNSSKPNKGSCSKVYSFSADIRTVNGPGSVNYSWQSSTSAGNGSGSFTVGDGNAITAVTKSVSLSCTKPASFSMQLALLTPSFSSSNTINVNHNCNEI